MVRLTAAAAIVHLWWARRWERGRCWVKWCVRGNFTCPGWHAIWPFLATHTECEHSMCWQWWQWRREETLYWANNKSHTANNTASSSHDCCYSGLQVCKSYLWLICRSIVLDQIDSFLQGQLIRRVTHMRVTINDQNNKMKFTTDNIDEIIMK